MSSTPAVPKYNEDLQADIETSVSDSPKVKVHRVEWAKVRCAQQALLQQQRHQLRSMLLLQLKWQQYDCQELP